MKNKKERYRNKNSNSGFTLIELVAAFVIMLLLASLSIAGVLAYQDYADFKRQNSYAQTLFSATQTALTGDSVRGQKNKLREAASGIVPLEKVINQEGISAVESEGAETAKNGTVYYLMGTRETYDKYLAGGYDGRTDAESVSAQVLYGMLEEFISEQAVLRACILIEYNPEQGQVYSVLYSDKCGSFTYMEDSGKGIVNVLNRQEDYRNEYMLGYYGLE